MAASSHDLRTRPQSDKTRTPFKERSHITKFCPLFYLKILVRYCVNGDGLNGFVIHCGLNTGPIFLSKS